MSRRVALVTGGTRGIGLAIARALAEDGLDLALCGRRSQDDVAPAVAILRALGAEILYEPADVGKAEDRARLLGAVRERFGRLHVLVNNAGMAPAARLDVLEAGEESLDHLLAVNLKGPHFLTQAVAHWMIAQKKAEAAFEGGIVNVGSVSAEVASPSRGEYCLSKAALAMSTRLWAVRLAEFGIPVYEVRPGIIRTDMTAPVEARYDRLIAEGLLLQPRWGTPEDVGRAVALLVRGELAYSTGAVIPVDGGLTQPRL
jgi:3-oxoacyl-[acyl-carrier protein] reductase